MLFRKIKKKFTYKTQSYVSSLVTIFELKLFFTDLWSDLLMMLVQEVLLWD